MTEFETLKFNQYNLEIFTYDQLLHDKYALFLITNENDKFYTEANGNEPKHFNIIIYKPIIERFLQLQTKINELYFNIKSAYESTGKEQYALLLNNVNLC